MRTEHKGIKQFLKGSFENGGDNLFVDAHGNMRRILDNDLNGTGTFDLVLPNTHGYIERWETYLYKQVGSSWEKTELPHDCGWMPIARDVDQDGHMDLIVCNAENGVSSELTSYIYWGGPNGLTGERSEFQTIGAYDAVTIDLTGNGLLDVIFTSAWTDHHNPGEPLLQKVFLQTEPRQFTDATEQYGVMGSATLSLACEDLTQDGYPDLIVSNLRKNHCPEIDSFVYPGKPGGFDTDSPICLPTNHATDVMACDLNGDGFKELVFSCRNHLLIYWNRGGVLSAGDNERIDINGSSGQFYQGYLPIDIADVDGDGVPELVVGTKEGVEIRKAGDLQTVYQQWSCYNVLGIKVADIHNRGRMDIIASHYCTQKTYDTKSKVFWNSESGFDPDNTTSFETHGPFGCEAADFDGDGVKEIVFANTMSGPSQYDPEFPAFVYFGTQDHKYLPENRRDYPIIEGAHTFTAADVDNDGYVELMLTTSPGVRVFKGTPDGPDPNNYYDITHTPGAVAGVGGVLVGDFNRNGWLDLVMAPYMTTGSDEDLENSIYVYRGGPDGYRDDNRYVLPGSVACPFSLQLADIDNDGYADLIYADMRGFIGVYHGGPDGFSRDRLTKVPLKDWNGAMPFSISVADINKDGWLEMIVTTGGHYLRLDSHLYILYNGKEGFPVEDQFIFDTGGTTGDPGLADYFGTGNLDILLPFYSTHETRELPARIFRADGKSGFDWDNPIAFDCLASIAAIPIDLNQNGYPDVFVCCHRNDLGHQVNSKLIRNGSDGLDFDNAEEFLGYGPHGFSNRAQGNSADRSENEYYLSPVFACDKPSKILWKGRTPHKTKLRFQARFGATEQDVLQASWSEAVEESGSPLSAPAGTQCMQYRVAFHAPAFVSSPTLQSVVIE